MLLPNRIILFQLLLVWLGYLGVKLVLDCVNHQSINGVLPKLLIMARLLTLKTFFLQFWFNKNAMERRKGRRNILMRVSSLEMVGPIQFLGVAVMKRVVYSVRTCFRSSMGQTVCSGTWRSTAQPTHDFPHDLLREGINACHAVYEINRHYQSANHLRQDQRYREKYIPNLIGEETQKFCKNIGWSQSARFIWIGKFQSWVINDRFILMC